MAITLSSYLESVESISPNSATMSPQQGRAPWTYIINTPTVNDLATFITSVFGTTNVNASVDGSLNRTLPITHPLWPSFYASSVQSLHGIGSPTVVSANTDPLLLGTQLPQMALYPRYAITIEFTPRIYVISTDASVRKVPGGGIPITWYPPVPGGFTGNNVAENPQQYFYASEWQRYTTFQLNASPEYVTAKQAVMKFYYNVAGAGVPIPNATLQALAPFPGLIQKFLQNQILKFWWFQVPYRFVYSAKSYIRKAIGRINQFQWYLWDAGQLLYLNYNIHPFPPPFPQYDQVPLGKGLTTTNIGLLCDIEFDFLVTTRTLASADQDNNGNSNLPTLFPQIPWQNNWIQQHHNLMPYWVDNRFHYVGRGVDQFNALGNHAFNTDAGTPPFFSFPYELLFTDPDSPGNTPFI